MSIEFLSEHEIAMTRRIYKSLILIFWILLLVASTEEAVNDPDLYYTCDEAGMHIKISFDRPFKGLVYVNGYSADPNCRLPLPVSTLEASFDIPLMACDTLVRPFLDSSPWLKGLIVIQKHPLIPTVDDSTEPFVCVIEKNTNITSWSDVLLKANYDLNASPKVYSWLDFELLPGISSEAHAVNFHPNGSYIFLYVNGVRQFNDMIVTDCVAHGEPFLTRNSTVYQMTDPNGCSNTFSEILSPFSLIKNDRGLIVGAYSEINIERIQSLHNAFISCSTVLCKHKCECIKDSSQIVGYEIFTSRKFLRRSKGSAEEMTSPSIQNYQTRNRLMRSTAKALAERLLKYRRQPKIEIEEKDFEKRVSLFRNNPRLIDTDDTTLGFNPTELFTSTFSTDFTSNVEMHNVLPVNISSTLIPEIEVDKILTNLVERPTTPEVFLNQYTTFKDSLSKNFSMTFISELETGTDSSQSTTETTANYETTLNYTDKQMNIPSERNEDLMSTANTNKDVNSTTNVNTETGKFGHIVGNNTIKTDESRIDNSYCVPKLKFVVVTTVLSFIVGCLILITCGLVLHLRKEKKKQAIDNFLLYNFY